MVIVLVPLIIASLMDFFQLKVKMIIISNYACGYQ